MSYGYQAYQSNQYPMYGYHSMQGYNRHPPPVNYVNNNIQGGYYNALNQYNGPPPPLQNIQVNIFKNNLFNVYISF